MATPSPAKKSAGKARLGSGAKSATRAGPKATPKRSRVATAKPSDQLRIRMYRLGIGDCFLLTLPASAGKPFHLLIDCGTHSSERGGPKNNRDPWRTEAAAADILEVTDGRLNAVIGTHEHWDHLSGFLQGKQSFEKCEAEVIWCSWAEDQKNEPIAQELVGLRRNGHEALWNIHQQIQAPSSEDEAEAAGLRDRLSALFGFFGESPGIGERARDAAEALLKLGRGRVKYLSPGAEPIEGPGGNWRIFVLGPPRNLSLLRHDQPRRPGQGYPLAGLEAEALNLAAIGAPPLTKESDPPFKAAFQITLEDTRGMAFFQRRYWNDAVAGVARDETAAQGFRRIGLSHLSAAEAFALKHDRLTNNTSLVVALELGPAASKDNPVILFAGDAQIGNWLSWPTVVWPDYHGRRVDGVDLIARTEIYKVGHHASHNATLMEGGLEEMKKLRVALVTVSQTTAKKLRWENSLPRQSILDRLKQIAREAVIRSDSGIEAKDAAMPGMIRLSEGTSQGVKDLFIDIEMTIPKSRGG